MAFTRNWPFFAGVCCYAVAAYISGGVNDLLNVDFYTSKGTSVTNYAGAWSMGTKADGKQTVYTFVDCSVVQDDYDAASDTSDDVCPYATGAYCRGMQSASGISIIFITLLLLHEVWVLGAGGDEAITMRSQYIFRAVAILMSMFFLLFMISVSAAQQNHDDCTIPSYTGNSVTSHESWEFGSSFIILTVFFSLGTVLFLGGAINRQWGDGSGSWPATSFTPLGQM